MREIRLASQLNPIQAYDCVVSDRIKLNKLCLSPNAHR
jgi:hypothetical protein